MYVVTIPLKDCELRWLNLNTKKYSSLKNALLKFPSTMHVFVRNFRAVDCVNTTEIALLRCSQESCSENIQDIYRRTPIPKLQSNFIEIKLYWETPFLKNTYGGTCKVSVNTCLWKILQQNSLRRKKNYTMILSQGSYALCPADNSIFKDWK